MGPAFVPDSMNIDTLVPAAVEEYCGAVVFVVFLKAFVGCGASGVEGQKVGVQVFDSGNSKFKVACCHGAHPS